MPLAIRPRAKSLHRKPLTANRVLPIGPQWVGPILQTLPIVTNGRIRLHGRLKFLPMERFAFAFVELSSGIANRRFHFREVEDSED